MRATTQAIAAASFLALTSLVACSATDSGSLHEPGTGVGDPATPPEAPEDDTTPATAKAQVDENGAPTWTSIYDLYFGPGSVGHCNDTRCHVSSRGRFMCGLTKDTCYKGLVASKLITPASPTRSPLTSSTVSPLSWFSSRGSMPPRGKSNPQASADISAWIGAGAKNN
jgi:hypothetical protein